MLGKNKDIMSIVKSIICSLLLSQLVVIIPWFSKYETLL